MARLKFHWRWVSIQAPALYRLARKSGRTRRNSLYGCYLHYGYTKAAAKFVGEI